MHRSFTRTPRSEYGEPDDGPLSFDLDGEKFECRPNLDAAAMYELGRRDLPAVVGSVGFIRLCLKDEAEGQRFVDALYAGRDDAVVDDDVLREIVRYLVTSLTSRPTRRSSGSAGGPLTTTGTSTADSPSAASDALSTSPAR